MQGIRDCTNGKEAVLILERFGCPPGAEPEAETACYDRLCYGQPLFSIFLYFVDALTMLRPKAEELRQRLVLWNTFRKEWSGHLVASPWNCHSLRLVNDGDSIRKVHSVIFLAILTSE